jgi:hypothetical protein
MKKQVSLLSRYKVALQSRIFFLAHASLENQSMTNLNNRLERIPFPTKFERPSEQKGSMPSLAQYQYTAFSRVV